MVAFYILRVAIVFPNSDIVAPGLRSVNSYRESLFLIFFPLLQY